jgi:predicted methyltransferase
VNLTDFALPGHQEYRPYDEEAMIMAGVHFWQSTRVILLACVIGALPVLAQTRQTEESRRDEWQKVDEIFSAMGVRSGATVADVGAGDGFFTSRLAKAVGPDGRVFAVDVDEGALTRLRKRLEDEGIRNVFVVKGTATDPKLPERALDAALIVNAYHEMAQHQQMLSALRSALKPDGKLVIVEPIADARRARSRAEQTKEHQIAPEFVLGDARSAGFRIVGMQDPFTSRGRNLEWLLALQPADVAAATSTTPDAGLPGTGTPAPETDPALRITQAEFAKLSAARAVTIVDVRDAGAFAAGHIPGALSVPLESVEQEADGLRKIGKPIVTYCS